jgi:hypothetical protein
VKKLNCFFRAGVGRKLNRESAGLYRVENTTQSEVKSGDWGNRWKLLQLDYSWPDE